MKVSIPVNYQQIVTVLKNKIRATRLQAALRLNTDLLAIYREIGAAIAEAEWGAKVVDNLSRDLKSEFQNMKPKPKLYARFRGGISAFPAFVYAPLRSFTSENFIYWQWRKLYP